MGSELELTVTITWKGSKATLDSIEEATSYLLRDLNALGIPHPKRANISVVWPGTIRFYWTALPNAPIHKTLRAVIEPTGNLDAHKVILDELLIENITLRVSEARSDSHLPASPGVFTGRKPEAGLTAVPMGGAASRSDKFPLSYHGRSSGETSLSNQPGSRPAPAQWDRPEPPPRIKTEPVSDVPIPPVDWRSYEADGIYLQHVDPGPRPLKRNRYDANGNGNGNGNGDVHNLRRELWEVRRRMNVEILREREISEKLRAHGVQEPPNVREDQDSEFATKARVQQLESELQTERALRRKADALVQDVRRECKTPFVVPALFDAFAEISQMTSDLVGER